MRKPGFSLIELLVVISVLAIVATLSLPTFSRFSASLSLEASAKTLVSELRALQSQAMSQHQTFSLNLAKLNLPQNIKFIKTSNISFASSGFPPPGGSGSLIMQNQFGRQKKIIVSSTGRVRLE